jgi:hypothetical protein
MNKLMLFSILLGLYLPTSNANAAQYSVSITNLTKGQAMHHPLLIFHSKNFSIFKLGAESSPGLKALATDADHKPIKRELRKNRRYIEKTIEARNVLQPGRTMRFNINSKAKVFSVLSMLATTNDGFLGGDKISLNLKTGERSVQFLNVYDAGVESNNELCAYIPGPPCNSSFKNTRSAEGFIHKHPGLYGIANLNVQKYGFNSNSAARIIIRRTR